MYTELQVITYISGSGLAGLILGYIIGRVVDRGKGKKLKADRDLHLKGRVIAEEAKEKAEGKLTIVKGVFKNT